MKNKVIIFGLLVFLFLSCSPPEPVKPIEIPKPKIPDWIKSELNEDSLYIYAVGKKEKLDLNGNSTDIIAIELLKNLNAKRVIGTLKETSELSGYNFMIYKDHILKNRNIICIDHIDIIDNYSQNNMSYSLAKLDKKSFENRLEADKNKAIKESLLIIEKLDSTISISNYKRLKDIMGKIKPFLDYYPLTTETSEVYDISNIIDIIKIYLKQYNEALSINFHPNSKENFPIVNENKRIIVEAFDKAYGKKVVGMWIDVTYSNSDKIDLIKTKSDGTVLYMVKSPDQNSKSYRVIFENNLKRIKCDSLIQVFSLKSKIFSYLILRPDSKVYVENIINNVNNKVRGSQFVSNIKVHFEKQYSAIFVDSLLESDLWLKLDVSLIEHEERVSKIYPYFVHASGILTIIDSKTETELYNQVIAEVKGSDFNSIEKAGINALKNLAKQLVNNIFSQ